MPPAAAHAHLQNPSLQWDRPVPAGAWLVCRVADQFPYAPKMRLLQDCLLTAICWNSACAHVSCGGTQALSGSNNACITAVAGGSGARQAAKARHSRCHGGRPRRPERLERWPHPLLHGASGAPDRCARLCRHRQRLGRLLQCARGACLHRVVLLLVLLVMRTTESARQQP